MVLHRSPVDRLELQDVGFALTWGLTLVLLIPVQLVSMIVFDSTGLDALSPVGVFMILVPTLLLAVLPTLVAGRLYSQRTALVTAGVAVVVFALVTAYTMGLYGVCGPTC